MENAAGSNRRDFLKTTAAGAAGVAIAGVAQPSLARSGAWTNKMPIHPTIDNARVVSCFDDGMVTGWPAKWSDSRDTTAGMAAQNATVVIDQVQANMDAMAMRLAEKTAAESAWATIFRKPSAKNWSDVRVAIKVNALGTNHPRLAVVDKVCRELNRLGVPFANMTIFDAGRNCTSLYSGFIGNQLPAGVNVSNGGPRCQVPAVGGTISCTDVVAKSVGGQIQYQVDIIVNIAVNKGHSQSQNGNVTLTMKNHLGTVNVNSCPNMDMLFRMSTSEAIIGGDPPPAATVHRRFAVGESRGPRRRA